MTSRSALERDTENRLRQARRRVAEQSKYLETFNPRTGMEASMQVAVMEQAQLDEAYYERVLHVLKGKP